MSNTYYPEDFLKELINLVQIPHDVMTEEEISEEEAESLDTLDTWLKENIHRIQLGDEHE